MIDPIHHPGARNIRLCVAAILTAACLAGAATSSAQPAAPQAKPKPSKTIEGRFDVGGHKLYLHCEGPAVGPTIVYLHGAIDNGQGGAISAAGVPQFVQDKHRMCVYDRANLGSSDKVAGPIGGKQLVTDLHTLLRKAGVKPPYLLLGASFGGLVAYAYAATYPQQVKGMLLLDSGFPTELKLEPLWPANERLNHNDWSGKAEKIDSLDLYEYANSVASRQPAIPVTYLLAKPSTWLGISPAYDAVIMKTMADYVHSFAPGIIKPVTSAHWMENAIPDRVAKELDLLEKKVAKS
jgi:pimeloyl-ACP methyl ester carboxylesterase